MPVIPGARPGGTPGGAALTRPLVAALPAAAAASSIAPLVGQHEQAIGERIKRIQRNQFHQASNDITVAANELSSEIAQDRNPDVEAYDAALDSRINEILGRIEDADVADAVEQFGRRRALIDSHDLNLRVEKFERDTEASVVATRVQNLAAGFALAGSPEARQNIINEINTITGMSEKFLGPEVAEQIRLESIQLRGIAAANQIMHSNPLGLLDQLDQKGHPEFALLSNQNRNMLRNSAKAAANARVTAENNARLKLINDNELEMAQRMTVPDHEKGYPTLTELGQVDPISRTGFMVLAGAIEKKSAGIKVEENAATKNTVRAAIASREITQFTQLIPFIGALGDSFNSFAEQITKTNSPDPRSRAIENHIERFYVAAKAQISGTVSGRNDPSGEEQFFEFWHISRQIIDARLAAGEPITKILDPVDRDGMHTLIQDFARDQVTIAVDFANSVLTNQGRRIEGSGDALGRATSALSQAGARVIEFPSPPVLPPREPVPFPVEDPQASPEIERTEVGTIEFQGKAIELRPRRDGESWEQWLGDQFK